MVSKLNVPLDQFIECRPAPRSPSGSQHHPVLDALEAWGSKARSGTSWGRSLWLSRPYMVPPLSWWSRRPAGLLQDHWWQRCAGANSIKYCIRKKGSTWSQKLPFTKLYQGVVSIPPRFNKSHRLPRPSFSWHLFQTPRAQQATMTGTVDV